MTAYLDTSALLKLYVDEAGSDAVWRALDDQPVATCRITWAEACAALARREREFPAAEATWSLARDRLARDWPAFHVIEVTQALVAQAGEFASVFALRGYDAVQLAAGRSVQAALDAPPMFLAFDRRLNRAARLLGLGLPADAPL